MKKLLKLDVQNLKTLTDASDAAGGVGSEVAQKLSLSVFADSYSGLSRQGQGAVSNI